MNWFVTAESNVSSGQLTRKMKEIIRNSSFFVNLFDKYNVPIDSIDDNLTFKIRKMRGRHAQSNSREITLNPKLFENGDFFENHLHFVIHELVHWLTRQRENKYYFSDPEEIEAFTLGMVYELGKGRKKPQIYRTFFPIIKAHFQDREDAIHLFNELYENAVKNFSDYGSREKDK